MIVRKIIITGCSSGIGAYCAHQLKTEGWSVFASARKPKDIALLKQQGIEAYYMDYAEPESIDMFFQKAMEHFDNELGAVLNNGGYCQAGPVEDLSVNGLRAQFEANLFGWHNLTQKSLKVMKKQGHGRIIQVSSMLGIMPVRWLGAYVSSKYALEGLMLSLSMELEDDNVSISLIEPGLVVSDIGINAMPHVLKNVDLVNSRHRCEFVRQLIKLKTPRSVGLFSASPDEVYRALRHALNSKSPKRQYYVTWMAKIMMFLKRILPSNLFYSIVTKLN